jgi:alpha-galactosidase
MQKLTIKKALAATFALVILTSAGTAFSQSATSRTDPLRPTGQWTAYSKGSAATPPMGWNSWNAFATAIDEAKVVGTAEALVSTGLARLGYKYVNIDDGWWEKRRQSDGRMQIKTSIFPSAAVGGAEGTSFRPLVNRLHGMGLKAGIYTDIGHISCSQSYTTPPDHLPTGTVLERQVGLAGNVQRDINLYFKDWGFDFIKVDACGIDKNSQDAWKKRGADYIAHPTLIERESLNRTNIPGVRAAFTQVIRAIEAANPDNNFVFSVCAWGAANVRAWGKDVGNIIRTSDDIRPSWTRMLHVFDTSASRPLYAQPGSWNDPDMLFVGHGEFDVNHLREAKSHFSLWAVINAPLLIGYDMRNAPKELLDIWGNADLVRANQDPGGHQGVVTYQSEDIQIIVKTLAGTDRKVVAILNRGVGKVNVKLLAQHLRFDPTAPVVLRDLWSKETLSPFTEQTAFDVESRETRVFEATGKRALATGYYLSEIPGRINVAVDGVVTPQSDPTVHRMVNPWEGTASGGTRPVYGGWGGAAADENPYGNQIRTGGLPFDIGIGILANSRLEIRNDGEFKTFTAQVGVDDNSLNTTNPISFLVYADGRLVGRSPAMKFRDAPFTLTAPIGNAKIVEIVAQQPGGKTAPAVAAWGEARLLR